MLQVILYMQADLRELFKLTLLTASYCVLILEVGGSVMFKISIVLTVLVLVGCSEPSMFEDIETESESDADTDTTTGGSVDSDSDTDSDSDGDTDANTDSDTDSASDSDSDDTITDTDTGTQTDTDTETETETQTDTETYTNTDTETDTNTDTVTGTETDTETESTTSTDLVCDPGETQLCYCVGAGTPEQGVQVCNETGTGWSECECRPDCPWNSGWPCPCAIPYSNMQQGIATFCNDGSQCNGSGYTGSEISYMLLGFCSPECNDPDTGEVLDVCGIDDYAAEGVCFSRYCYPTCGTDSDCPPETVCFETDKTQGYPWNVCRPIP